MKGSEMFIARAPPLLAALCRGGCAFARGRRRGSSGGDAYARPQLVVAVDHDGFAGGEAALDQRLAVAACGDPHRAGLDGRILPDHEGVSAVRSRLHRRFRHDRPTAHAKHQARAHELAGPELPILILKDRLEPDRAGSLIDLVVDQLETAFGELDAVVLIVGGYGERGAPRRI